MKTLHAIFENAMTANQAIHDLEEAGVDRERIGLVMSESARDDVYEIEEGTKAVEGAAGGALVGGALGAIAAGLTAVGTVVLPGVGFLAVGPIAAALAGAGAGGAVGGMLGGLLGMGVPEYEAKLFAEKLQAGSILVTVHALDAEEEKAAHAVFAQYHGREAA